MWIPDVTIESIPLATLSQKHWSRAHCARDETFLYIEFGSSNVGIYTILRHDARRARDKHVGDERDLEGGFRGKV